jgi:hypothetical protein
MNFEMSEDHKAIKEAVSNFTAKRILPIRKNMKQKDEFPWDLLQEMGEMKSKFLSGFSSAGEIYL